MATNRPKPSTTVARDFVLWHLGKGALAPLTGTDWRAWNAFVYLLELWGVSHDPRAVDAMRSCIACAQISVLDIFIQTIPAMLDWSDVRRLWPQIAPGRAPADLAAFDVSHDRSRAVRYFGREQVSTAELGAAPIGATP